MAELINLPVKDSLDAVNRRMDRLEMRHGDGGGGMEARIARLEASVSHIEKDVSSIWLSIDSMRKNMREDFRILFGALIAVALGLGGMMAKGFRWF